MALKAKNGEYVITSITTGPGQNLKKKRRRVGNSNYHHRSKNDEATLKDSTKDFIKLSDPRVKKAIIIGASVAVAGLAVYGLYKFDKVNTINFDSRTGKEIDSIFRLNDRSRSKYVATRTKVANFLSGYDPNVKFENGLPLKSKEFSMAEDLSEINPVRVSILSDTKNFEIIPGSSANCMLCTTAYDLRRRGYDVHAGFSKQGFYPNRFFKEVYKNPELVSIQMHSSKRRGDINPISNLFSINNDPQSEGDLAINYKSIESKLLSLGSSGSRGNIVVQWGSGIFGGHSMIWENVDGKIQFMDGQTNQVYKDFKNEVLKNVGASSQVIAVRTDNLELNYDRLSRYVNTKTSFGTYAYNSPKIALNVAKKTVPLAVFIGGNIALAYYSGKQFEEDEKNDRRSNKNFKETNARKSN